MFVPYFSLFNIHSHTPVGENPRFLWQVWTRLKLTVYTHKSKNYSSLLTLITVDRDLKNKGILHGNEANGEGSVLVIVLP